VQLAAVFDQQYFHSMGNCRQLLEGNFLGHRICVLQIQPFENLAVGKLAVNDFELHLEPHARAVFRRLHFGFVHHHVVPASGDWVLLSSIGDNSACIKI
jgi:hypothetical protein